MVCEGHEGVQLDRGGGERERADEGNNHDDDLLCGESVE